jgi:membrane-associated phospholipid phosphatase
VLEARPASEIRERRHVFRYWDAVRARDPRTLKVSVIVLALIASASAFGHVTEDYLTGDPIVRWDVHFARWLHLHADHPLVRVMNVITFGGNPAVLIGLGAVLAVLYFRRRRPNDAALLLVALGGAGLINGVLKLLFHRPRPKLAFVHPDHYSFPSGHAAVSAATFTTLAYLIGRRKESLAARIAIGAVAALAIAIICFSRLYLGVHYLSDVLAGASFGLAWAMLCLLAYTLWGERNVLDLLPRRFRR